MADYTLELNELLRDGYNLGLGIADYELIKETYLDPVTEKNKNLREELNGMILDHFRFREIGFETPARFRYFLNRKMREIMPYYNQIFKSQFLEFNPLYNIELYEDYTHTVDNTGKTTQSSTDINTGGGTENSTSDTTNTGGGTENLTSDTTNTGGGTEHSTADIVNTGGGTDHSTLVATNTDDNLNVSANTPQSKISDAEIREHNYASSTAHDVKANTTSNTNDSTSTVNNTSNVVNNSTTTNTNSGSVVNTSATTNNNTGSVANTSATTRTNTGTNEGLINSEGKTIESYHKTELGSSAGLSFNVAVKQWRGNMLNIFQLIFTDLEPLFMQLW